ncbi:hypothetical protein J3Q64DRAFT_1837250 [Phycomyces blakesleeanus]|uniref:Uncharacterized protein n=2 Tax=Phycomyces blakesleeanus TaxID=4837 RepID=A0A162WAX7_PHYB8|nr:hypothetical protein PHYBLDRAFT_73230 [Phycomyces blakesleeanus NRRL 1555(-)]OAD65995.1 hypothetical protein PHYBLDRAFT_73230 [Phycomyces blakesleeanus NRRL 1555(-)]|eukprot:XP_018284035.1 hypothetical protein PHYBLDRAFT_73230 [Phycomyces blakesleeanus NRRL 1555(-)]
MEISRIPNAALQKYIFGSYALGKLILSVQAAAIPESSISNAHSMVSASPTDMGVPTTTAQQHIVSGSTMSLATSGISADLTGLDLSPLYGSATPTINSLASSQPTIPATISASASIENCGQSGCSTKPSQTVVSIATTTGLTGSSENSTSGGLSTGAIAGIAVGSGVLVLFALFCFWRTKRRKPKFDRGRGITPSMFFDNTQSRQSQNPQNLQTKEGSSGDRLSAYSFTSPNAAFGYCPQPLSEKTTAMLDQMYNIKQYNNPNSTAATAAAAAAAAALGKNDVPGKSTARLSKYNYLTQVFSQMRASTAEEQIQQQQQQQQQQSSVKVRQVREKDMTDQPEMRSSGPDRTLHESTVLGPHQPEDDRGLSVNRSIVEMAKLNSTFNNINTDNNNPGAGGGNGNGSKFGDVPAISVSPPPPPPTTATTGGGGGGGGGIRSTETLQQPQKYQYQYQNQSRNPFQSHPQQQQQQTPPRIAVYNEHDEQKEIIDPYRGIVNGRDSMMSEVSQYSTFSTDTNPFRASTGSADSVTLPYIPQQPQPVVHSQRYEYI